MRHFPKFLSAYRGRDQRPTENDSIGFGRGDVKFVLASVALISQRSFISETGSLLTSLFLFVIRESIFALTNIDKEFGKF